MPIEPYNRQKDRSFRMTPVISLISAVLVSFTWNAANAACWASNLNGNRECSYFVDKAGLKIQLCEDQPGDCERIGYQKQLANGEQPAPKRGRTRLKHSHASSTERRESVNAPTNGPLPVSIQTANAGGQSNASWWPVILVVLTIGSGMSAAVVIWWKFRGKMRSRRQVIYSSAAKIAGRRLEGASFTEGNDGDDEVAELDDQGPPDADQPIEHLQALVASESPVFHADVAETNKDPFRRMLAGLSAGDGGAFSYWADLVSIKHTFDVQEYLARAFRAAFAAGVLTHFSLLTDIGVLEFLSTDSFAKDSIDLWKRLVRSRDFTELEAGFSSLKQDVARMESDFKTALDHIEQFISYRSFPEFAFFIDDDRQPSEIESRVSEMTTTVIDRHESLTNTAKQFAELCQRANTQPTPAAIQELLMAVNQLLDELNDWLGDAAIKDTGRLYAANALSNLERHFYQDNNCARKICEQELRELGREENSCPNEARRKAHLA